MEKILLLAPKNFKLASTITYDKLETDDVNIFEILEDIIKIEADILIIPVEQSIKGVDATYFSGLELIKHIRLTPELAHVNKKPIICLHWHTLDYYIKKDKENIFLYSNAIYTYRLPNFKLELEKYKELDSDLKPYLFGLDKDITINEHNIRDESAIKQFTERKNNSTINLLEKDISYKKLFYLSYPNYIIDDANTIDTFDKSLKCILIDDNADKWIPALNLFCINTEFKSYDNANDFLQYIEGLKKSIDESNQKLNIDISRIQNDIAKISELTEEISIINTNIKSTKSTINNLERQIVEIQNKNLVNESNFNTLVNELMQNGGLLEVLMDNEGEKFTEANKKGATQLSNLITEIFNAKNELKSKESLHETNITKLSELENQKNLKTLDKGNLNQLIKKHQNIISQTLNIEYDCVLVDLYFDGNTKVNINESAGYKLICQLLDLNFNIPIMVFSASKRELNFQYNSSSIYRFIKGFTPLDNFKSILEEIVANRELFELLKKVENLRNYNTYYARAYRSHTESEYNIIKIHGDKTTEIKTLLKSISEKLLNLISKKISDREFIKNQYLEICTAIGKIQENRQVLPGHSKNNSYYHHNNLNQNKISNDEVEIRNDRNASTHKTEQQNIERVQKINLSTIRGHIDTTFKKLLFG